MSDIDSNLLNELRIDGQQRESDRSGAAPRWLWPSIAAALVAVLLAGTAWWWLGARPIAVQTATAIAPGNSGAAGALLQATGYITARRMATVSTQITGTLTQVLIEEGDTVQKGQIIARLEDSGLRASLDVANANALSAQAQIATAQAQLAQAQADSRRQESLVASGMATRQFAEQSRTEGESMKYLHLVWAALFRRKTRTFLTLVSIIAAFLLFGLLDAVRTSFTQAGQSANGAQRLQTSSKLSFIQTLPQSLEAQIAAVPGIKTVTYANWFGGAYQDPHNQVFSFAVEPNYLDLYPEVAVTAAERKAFDQTRTGALVGEALAKRFNWKVGDKIPLQSTIFPDRAGSKNWSFDMVGILHATDKKSGGFFDQMFLLHWKYFDETTPYNRGQVGWYVTRVADVNQADRIAKAIDAISVNSDHETRTQTEQAATASWMKQLADIGLIVGSIMGAVFFTLLLLSGNTMMQAVRERTGEIAVLKTIGFTNLSVLSMVLAESVLLLLLGGVIGLAIAALLIPVISAASGGMLNLPTVGKDSWLLGLVLMGLIGLLVGSLPAWSAMRLNIVDALAGR